MKKIILALLMLAGLMTVAPRAEARHHDREYRSYTSNHYYYGYPRYGYGYGYRHPYYYRPRVYSYYRPARYYYDDYDYCAPRPRYYASRPRFSFFFGL